MMSNRGTRWLDVRGKGFGSAVWEYKRQQQRILKALSNRYPLRAKGLPIKQLSLQKLLLCISVKKIF